MEAKVGANVLYTFKDRHNDLVTRPGIIVRVWNPNYVNLVCFIDGSNDLDWAQPLIWATSVGYSEEPVERTFKYPD